MSEKISHASIRPGGPPKDTPTAQDMRWWGMDAEASCGAISANLAQLADQETARAQQLVRSLRMYGNAPMSGFHGLGAQPVATTQAFRDRMSFNLVQSVVDTKTSKIGKNKPKPFYVTSAGDSNQRRKAKNRNKFLEGIFYENKAHALGRLAFRDGEVLDAGVIKVYALHGRIRYERVHSSSIKVDDLEAAMGFPRQMHEIRFVDRALLMGAFPSKKKIIASAPTAHALTSRQGTSDLIEVRESWHLPSSPDSKDGKHIITIDGGALTKMEEWTHDFFPFAFYRSSPRVVGFWGQGSAERLQPLQIEINKLLYKIQRTYHLGGSFKILMEMGSKIAPEHFNNDIGTVIKYSNVKPEYIVPPLLPPEIYQHLRWLIEQGYEQEGVNQLSSSGQVPLGMEKASGKALRTLGDIQSDRFQTTGAAYEDLFMQLATCTLAVAKDLFVSGEITEYEVKVPHPRWIERLKMTDVDLDEDDNFVLQRFPISSLPDEPGGRIATVTEMMEAGIVDRRTGNRLMTFPDLEQEESLSGAAEDYLTKILDEMVEEEDEYTPPDPFDDLSLGFELAQQYYLSGKRDNLDPEKLDKLRRFMGQCQSLMQAANPPAPAAAIPPQAVPTPTPVSPLLPNGPQAAA